MKAIYGEVTERLKVYAWKAYVLKGTQGSNPCLSAISFYRTSPRKEK